jgi:hypothetical protein
MQRATWWAACGLAVSVFGCAPEVSPAPVDADMASEGVDTDAAGDRELLPPRERAVRVSMALRGVRPTGEELAEVEASPDALAALTDRWLTDPRTGETVRDMWAEILSMRDVDLVYPQLGPLAQATQQQMRDAISEEPLALIADIFLQNRPFTGVVTEGETLLDATAAKIWSRHTYDPQGPAVQRVRYTDGRPDGGILSANGLWARHVSAGSNYHRGRADRVADALLCEDFLDRDVPITGQIDLADDDAVASALRTDPACVSCHQALDPLAAHLWVFHPEYSPGAVGLAYLTGCFVPFLELCYPFDPYRPEYDLGRLLLGLRPPGYYGYDTHTGLGPGRIDGLGAAIASDPRFSSCMARRFWSYLHERPLDDAPFTVTARLQQRFIESGFSARQLVRDIVLHPDFLAISSASPGVDARLPGPLVVRPFQHAALVEQLTGFRFRAKVDGLVCGVSGLGCYGDADLATDDAYGFDAMSGGFDGRRVQRPTHTMTPVKLLFASALAEESAAWAVANDLAQPAADRRLLRQVEATTRDPDAVRAQLQALHDVVLLEPVDEADPLGAAELDAWWALWDDVVGRTGDPVDGWRAVLATMLQDPRVLFY